MNIKTMVNNISSIDTRTIGVEKKEVRSESSSEDRDADGRRQQEEQPEKEHLSEEEVAEVLEALKSIPGVKDHNLSVAVERMDNKIFFKLTDAQGKIIRRMDSNEGWYMAKRTKEKTGRLLDKAL